MNIALLTGWSVIQSEDNKFYISGTHNTYLNYLINKFDTIYLIVPVQKLHNIKKIRFECISNKIQVIPLPFFNSYKNAIPFFTDFFRVIRKVNKDVDLFYCRVPDPFSWLPKLITHKPVIMHYVGDPINVILTNSSIKLFNKLAYLFLFMPEFLMTLLASKFSMVYTNGFEIAKKLNKIRIKAIPLISSTLTKQDFIKKDFRISTIINLLYIGYLRPSKGVETLIYMMKEFEDRKLDVNIKLNIVGDGEERNYLQRRSKELGLNSIKFYGHVDDRNKLRKIMSMNDIFVFPSLSEGSPRVVLEAMANSLPVISTPVGALPNIFKNNENIIFVDFKNPAAFCDKVLYLWGNPSKTREIIDNAFNIVKENYTIDKFLGKIFNEA